MSDSIDNKFRAIKVDDHEGNSKITIKKKFLNLKAIVECGSCEEKYTQSLKYVSNYFIVKNQELKCECGNIDFLSYSKRR